MRRFLDLFVTLDVFLAVPPPILMVIISTRWFEIIDPFKFGLIYGVMAGASSVAVVMRSQGLKMMTQPFIEASRVAGASHSSTPSYTSHEPLFHLALCPVGAFSSASQVESAIEYRQNSFLYPLSM